MLQRRAQHAPMALATLPACFGLVRLRTLSWGGATDQAPGCGGVCSGIFWAPNTSGLGLRRGSVVK